MNKHMIIAGLKARPVRTTVSILAVALEVVLILVVVGLTTGIASETAKRTAGVGAEIMVQPPNSSMILALTNNTMPIKLGDEIRKLPAVQAVAPVQVLMNAEGGIEIVFGIDPKDFDAVTGGFSWHQGGMFKEPKDIVVDDLWANAKSAHPGDTVELLNQKFKVTGIVEHGKGARVFTSMRDTGEMTGQVDKVGVFFVKLKDPSPATLAAAKAQLNQLLPTYTIRDMQDFETLMSSSNIPGLSAFIDAVVLVALCIGVLVIFLSMYTTITERTREIGILRSLGASKSFIVAIIFQEATLVCVLGVLLGIALSFLIERVLAAIFPTLMVQITVGWVLRAAAFAVLSGVIGSLYPSLKAAKQDPVEALAYE
jgi:putative ABC transport system permease protein